MASEAPSKASIRKARAEIAAWERLDRTCIAAPCGWRAVFTQPDGQIEERPVACFVVIGRGTTAELRPMFSFAGAVYEVASGDYRGMVGPGQTADAMLAEWQAGEDRYAETERTRREESARSAPDGG